MACLILLSDNLRVRKQVETFLEAERAVCVRHDLLSASSWRECRRLAERRSEAVVLVDPFLGGEFAKEELRELLRTITASRLVAYADFSDRSPVTHLLLGDMGVRNLIWAGKDDHLVRLRKTILLHAIPSPTLHWLVEACRRLRSEEAAGILGFFARLSLTEPLENSARTFGCSLSTLERRMRAMKLPTPEAVRRWMRVIRAAYLLGDAGRRVEDVISLVGYWDCSSLRKASHATCRVPPTGLSRALKEGRLRRRLTEEFFAGRGPLDPTGEPEVA